MKLDFDDLHDYVRGAAFLGAGGGGDPYIGRLLLRQEMEDGRTATIIDLDELADDARVATVAAMGAPTVMIERFPKIATLETALETLQKRLGLKFDALIGAEAGGINGTLPLIAGARTGLPVVDGDGMGRAFPELQMVTYNIYGLSASPVILVDDHNNRVIVEAGDNKTAEDFARAAIMAMHGEAQIALYAMTGAEPKRAAVPRTLLLALDIGRAIASARRSNSDPVVGLVDHLKNRADPRFAVELFHGKIVDLARETRAGFAFGRIRIEAIAGDAGVMDIAFQNENLEARRDGELVAMVPDLICVLDSESAEPITTEGLKYGQRVRIVGVGVPPIMRSDPALAVFGPQAFGIEADYRPIEELFGQSPSRGARQTCDDKGA